MFIQLTYAQHCKVFFFEVPTPNRQLSGIHRTFAAQISAVCSAPATCTNQHYYHFRMPHSAFVYRCGHSFVIADRVAYESSDALNRIHIRTRMPNEACGNDRNVNVDVQLRHCEQRSFVWQMFGEQSNAICLESVLQRKIRSQC